MNIKKTINFKILREKGPNAVNITGDEVVQLVAQGTEIKYILTQEHYINLETAYNALLVRSGLREDKILTQKEINSRLKNLSKKTDEIAKLSKEK